MRQKPCVEITVMHAYGYQIRSLFDLALYKLGPQILCLWIEFTCKDFVTYPLFHLSSIFFIFAEADKHNLYCYFPFDFDDGAAFLRFCLLVPEVFILPLFCCLSHAAFQWLLSCSCSCFRGIKRGSQELKRISRNERKKKPY